MEYNPIPKVKQNNTNGTNGTNGMNGNGNRGRSETAIDCCSAAQLSTSVTRDTHSSSDGYRIPDTGLVSETEVIDECEDEDEDVERC